MAHHEVLGKILGAFELRCFLRWPENAMTGGAHRIDDTCSERRFGADHGQRDFIFLNKINNLLIITEHDVMHAILARRACIARRNKHFRYPQRLREFPRQRMFAATAADHQNFHKGRKPCKVISRTKG